MKCYRCEGQGYREDRPSWNRSTPEWHNRCFRCAGTGIDPKSTQPHSQPEETTMSATTSISLNRVQLFTMTVISQDVRAFVATKGVDYCTRLVARLDVIIGQLVHANVDMAMASDWVENAYWCDVALKLAKGARASLIIELTRLEDIASEDAEYTDVLAA